MEHIPDINDWENAAMEEAKLHNMSFRRTGELTFVEEVEAFVAAVSWEEGL